MSEQGSLTPGKLWEDWGGAIQKEYLPLSHKCDHFDASCTQILGWNTAEHNIRTVLFLPAKLFTGPF